jgi:hypothetical protein
MVLLKLAARIAVRGVLFALSMCRLTVQNGSSSPAPSSSSRLTQSRLIIVRLPTSNLLRLAISIWRVNPSRLEHTFI